MPPEIDWGPETTKPDTGRLAHIEHAIIVKHTREAEHARIVARNARMQKLILMPVGLVVAGAVTVAALDYFRIINLGLFPRTELAPVVAVPVAQPSEQDTATAPAKRPAIVSAPVMPNAPASIPADPARMARAKDRAEHATHGIKILSDELDQERAALTAGESLIANDQVQLPSAEANQQQAAAAHAVLNARGWEAEVERLQTEIRDQSSADDESRDHITSLCARLAKAQKDFVDASAEYIMAEGSAGGIGQ